MNGSLTETYGQGVATTSCGRWIAVAVIVLATLFGGAVRLSDLGGGGVWFDELYTLRDVSSGHSHYSPTRWLGYQPTKYVLWALGTTPDAIPGDQYWAYQDAGVSMRDARLASCLIGLLAIPLFGWAGWRPLGPGAAAMLAVLVALCVWNVSWSQTARFYTQIALFGGLAVLFYIDAITTGSRWRFAAAAILVVLAYLSHPPAILIGLAFLLDAGVQMIRRRPLNYGKWGWCWGLGSIATCIAILLYENVKERRYDFTSAGNGASAEGPLAQSAPMIVIYAVIMLTPALVIGAAIGLSTARKHRGAWVLAYAAALPVVGIAATAATGGYGHGRYAYVSMIGWVGLAAVGMWVLAQALRPKVGPLVAWTPAAMLLVGMMPALGSYLTGGHRFIEPFHLAWLEIQDDVQPDDVVFAERFEIGQYYLEREDVLEIPGVLSRMDELAQGQPAWVVRLSANSRGRRHWVPADDGRMQLIDREASAVWLPYREVSVYRLAPLADSVDTATVPGE